MRFSTRLQLYIYIQPPSILDISIFNKLAQVTHSQSLPKEEKHLAWGVENSAFEILTFQMANSQPISAIDQMVSCKSVNNA